MFDLQQLEEVREQWMQDQHIMAKIKSGKFCDLVFAGEYIDEEKCIEMLNDGANPNVQSKYVVTAFVLVCQQGLVNLARTMIEHGAFPDQKGSYGDTPLCAALQNDHSDIASMLIEAGANVNVTGNSQFTPLIAAAARGNDKIVNKLLERGADSEYRLPEQYRGMNAEEIAKHNDHNSTAELIGRLKQASQPSITLTHGATYPDAGDEYYDVWLRRQIRIVRFK